MDTMGNASRPDGAVRAPVGTVDLPVSGDAAWSGAWTIRYENAAGRAITSEPKPTLDAAISQARQLRDQRGAIVLEIAPCR
jgi:hypothetical protein